MKKRFLTMLSLIIVLCGLLVGCGDLSHGSISRNRPIDTTAKGSEDLVPEQADSLPEQEGSSMECSENVPDTTFAEDNIDIPEEYLTENGNVEYTVNENGEYVWNGLLFRHKLVLTSRSPRDKHFIFVYIVLTNDTELTSEKIFKDSLSSQAIPLDVTQKYPSYYVVLGNHALYEELHDSEDPVPEQADLLPEQEGNNMENSENVPDTTSTEDNIDIPEEYLTENYDVEYTVNENGEYVWNGLLFRHKLVVTSRDPRDKHFISIYIVLTNDTELTLEKISKDHLSSYIVPLDVTQEYPSYYVVLGNHVYEEPHDSEDPVLEQEGNNMENSENVPDTTSIEDNIDIPEEYLTENYDVEYTVNENGEYVWNGLLFRHKLVLTSRSPRDKHFISIYIVLTNDTELTAEKIFKDSISSQAIPLDVTQEYPSCYIILGIHVYEEPH